jgi:hypothetical protein
MTFRFKELKMFDWFGKTFRRGYSTVDTASDMEKIGNDMSKVVPFPELKAVPAPEPEPEKPGRVFYRLGLSDNNRVALSMYYGEISMNGAGVQRLIDQLEFYKSQLSEDEEQSGVEE